MYFICVIRKKEHKSFFLFHLLTNKDNRDYPILKRDL